MAFNGSEGEFMEIEEAGNMTRVWRESNNGEVKGVFFGREKLLGILNQENCEGIRMYFALNEEKQKTLVLVGAMADQDDMADGLILERGAPCPKECGKSNALNS